VTILALIAGIIVGLAIGFYAGRRERRPTIDLLAAAIATAIKPEGTTP